MRFYEITITDKDSGALIQADYFKTLGVPWTFGSTFRNGPLTNALNIEFDVPVAPYSQPRQGSWLRVWGVSLQELARAGQMAFANITVRAGMMKGLPLANPKQAGVILQGTVFQPYGNWSGTDQYIDMTFLPPAGTINQPVNIVFQWAPNTPMGDAIKQSLTIAFPKYSVEVAVSPSLVSNYLQTGGPYSTLADFSTMIARLSLGSAFKGIKPLGGGPYPGVNIVIRPATGLSSTARGSILVFDGTQNVGGNTFDNPKQINFQDLIGQPTWISPTQINFRCVVRADIGVGDFVQFPSRTTKSGQIQSLGSPFILTSSPAASLPNTPARNQSAFLGKFRITELHHFANFRQADAGSWATMYDAVYLNPAMT